MSDKWNYSIGMEEAWLQWLQWLSQWHVSPGNVRRMSPGLGANHRVGFHNSHFTRSRRNSSPESTRRRPETRIKKPG